MLIKLLTDKKKKRRKEKEGQKLAESVADGKELNPEFLQKKGILCL